MSVSYTHLTNTADLVQNFLCWTEVFQGNMEPVSYTHLDVYKRQVLKGATSLFLEIPFFIAAYKFLSGLQLLNGVSFGPIADLGRPDGLLAVSYTHLIDIHAGSSAGMLCRRQ